MKVLVHVQGEESDDFETAPVQLNPPFLSSFGGHLKVLVQGEESDGFGNCPVQLNPLFVKIRFLIATAHFNFTC